MLLHEILLHIQVLESRRIYLDRGYSSCFLYLVEILGYSSSAAMRRLDAARLLKEIPEVAEQIESGSLNLSQIGELSRAIKEKEKTSSCKIDSVTKQELIEKILDKTTIETQKDLSKALDLDLREPEKTRFQKDDSVNLSLTLTAEQFEKLSRCKDLAAAALFQSGQEASWAAVLEHLSDQFLKRKNASTKSKIPADKKTVENPIAASEVENANNADKMSPSKTESALKPNLIANKTLNPEDKTKPLPKTNKNLTPKIRKIILHRDKCCQYRDAITGKLCGSRFGLEVDHIHPRWAEGHHDPENLQALCRQHNGHRYRGQAQIRFL